MLMVEFSLPRLAVLQIEAWDADTTSLNDKLGDGAIDLKAHKAALERGERVECKVPLQYTPLLGKAKEAGEVFLALTWEPAGSMTVSGPSAERPAMKRSATML